MTTKTAPTLFATIFTEHPASVDETYLQHARFAFWLGLAALAALVHAVIPKLCETTASTIIRRLVARMDARH